ncbi:HAD family hydrolase [Gordonia insulae]|uniref:(S)-2-haloacid dehalogenase 4A n=1 Tax=Gordonia insulae TaxID=2420509 RepID=A0A3G8JJS2_9ACTN|nr:HAD family hydrolase [Gordonia insulae]AZG44460.1 (S)-2-haloacid dehalogenase 4A [Gordonia insulae]
MDGSDSASPTDTTSPVDTVLLDVDGTLIDSTYLHALAWIRAFAAHDLRPAWWRVHRTVGMGGDLLVGELCGPDVEDRLGDALRAEWADRYREVLPEVRPLPGARRFVEDLNGAGLTVALASSGAAEFTDAALDILRMNRDDFAAVTSSEDVDVSKPEPDILATALDRAGGTRAVLVGDTVWDIESARRLDAECVAVRSGGFAEAELSGAGAVLVVETVGDLADRGWRP